MSNPAAEMEWGECWLEPAPVSRELAAEIRQHTHGMLPGWSALLAPAPWLLRCLPRLTEQRIAHMPLELWGPVALVVSRDNSCRYCYGMTRTTLKVLGHGDRYIAGLERDLYRSDLPHPQQVALDFARKVSHANPRPTAADRVALAREGFSAPAVAEIAYAAAANVIANRLATLLALPSERFLRWLDHPLARIVRPLLARQMRGRRAAPAPAPQPNDGPCAAVVAALDGSPAARVLREVIDEAIASPILPRRTKLLMLAVIGRALGCAYSEREACAGLTTEGYTPADVEEVLANLGSPKLDARDALLVPFARETVRYQNAAIQERTRALREHLAVGEVLEAVGVAALANGVCRLSVLLEPC